MLYIAFAIGILVFATVLGRVAEGCLFLSRSPKFPMNFPLWEDTGCDLTAQLCCWACAVPSEPVIHGVVDLNKH